MTHIVQSVRNKTGLEIKTKCYTHSPGHLEKPIHSLGGKGNKKAFRFFNFLG